MHYLSGRLIALCFLLVNYSYKSMFGLEKKTKNRAGIHQKGLQYIQNYEFLKKRISAQIFFEVIQTLTRQKQLTTKS